MSTNNTPSSSESDPERRQVAATESARRDKLLKRLKPYWMMEGANVLLMPLIALRPRILLPSFLIDRMEDEALRILIAHEMTHIRRGDLFWAFLQTVAGSLWWFHPAVWIANRQLNLECERSCDEETIARLECPPCAYAKCLLQVLEWKHQLYVVPALPGVRPMQITKDRLKRIMKMRHGSFSQNSRGLWLAMAAFTKIGHDHVRWNPT
jgi:beta-lactamase regulating signal transducer with metallopeptidase domain